MGATQVPDIEQINRDFEDRGYVILKGLLEPEIIDGVRRDLEHWVDARARQFKADGLIENLFEDEPFESRLARVFEAGGAQPPTELRRELHWPGMFNLFFHPRVLDIVERRLGPEIRIYPNYSVRPKLPDDPATQVLWHQDAAYTASGRHGTDPNAGKMSTLELRMVNVWVPLVPARPENGCMKFIPGTHKIGLVPHNQQEFYLEIVETEINPRIDQAVDVITDPGDVVLFSNLLFHMGQPNRSKTVRWSADWRYQDARQSTMREHHGHIARSRSNPASEVKSVDQWA